MKKEITVSRFIEVEFLETKNKYADIAYAKWKDQDGYLVFLTHKSPDPLISDAMRNPQMVKNAYELFYLTLPKNGNWTPMFVDPEFFPAFDENRSIVEEMQKYIHNDYEYGELPPENSELIFVENDTLMVLDSHARPLTLNVRSFLSDEVHNILQIKSDINSKKLDLKVDWEGFDMVGMGNCYNFEVEMTQDDYFSFFLEGDTSVIDKYIGKENFKEVKE